MKSSSQYSLNSGRDLTLDLQDMEPPVSAILRGEIESLARLIPTWCVDLRVRMVSLDDNTIGLASVSDEYRSALIEFDPYVLTLDRAQRLRIIAHELVHVILQPLAGEAKRLADRMDGDGPQNSPTRTNVRRAVEMVTCDLERAFLDAPRRTEATP